MSHRLQILLAEEEFGQLKKQARHAGRSVSEWVRTLIRDRITGEQAPNHKKNLARLREMKLPAPPIDQMLSEIEKGRR